MYCVLWPSSHLVIVVQYTSNLCWKCLWQGWSVFVLYSSHDECVCVWVSLQACLIYESYILAPCLKNITLRVTSWHFKWTLVDNFLYIYIYRTTPKSQLEPLFSISPTQTGWVPLHQHWGWHWASVFIIQPTFLLVLLVSSLCDQIWEFLATKNPA